MVRAPDKRRRGRPKAEITMVQIAIRLPADLLAEIDDIVAGLKNDPMMRAERSAVIRALLLEGLAHRQGSRKGKR